MHLYSGYKYSVDSDFIGNDKWVFEAKIYLDASGNVKRLSGFKSYAGAVLAAQHWIDLNGMPGNFIPEITHSQKQLKLKKLLLRLVVLESFFVGVFLASAILSTTKLLLLSSITCLVVGVLALIFLVRWHDEIS